MKKLLTVLALAFLVSPGQAQTPIRVGLATPLSPLQAYYVYGKQLGLYEEQGLTAEFISVAGASILLPQLSTKAIDFALTNPDMLVIAQDKGEPYPVRLVFNVFSSQIFEFVVLDDSPVRTLGDLKGMKVGVGALSWSNLPMSRVMLKDAGLVWGQDVQVVPVGVGPSAWSRLSGRSVDALNLFVSQHALMAASGVRLRKLPMPEKYRTLFANGFAAHNDTIRQKPELVEKFGRAMARSLVACREKPEACVKSFWEYDPASRPAPEREEVWVRQNMMAMRAELDAVFAAADPDRLGAYSPEAWKQFLRVMLEGGQIKSRDMAPSLLYTGQFVQSFNRWDRAELLRKLK